MEQTQEYVSSSSRDDCRAASREEDLDKFIDNLYSDDKVEESCEESVTETEVEEEQVSLDLTNKELRDMLLKVTERIQSKHHKFYERSMMNEYKQHQNRLELAERYIMGSKYVPVTLGVRVDYPLATPLRCDSSEQRVSPDKNHILSFRKVLTSYDFDLRTGVVTDKGRCSFFEGKRVVRGPEYHEGEGVIVLTERAKMLYRDEEGIVRNYECETGFSFYHDAKIVPVHHTSPETKSLGIVSVVIGEAIPRPVEKYREIQSPADIIDYHEKEMKRKERCYFAKRHIFYHRGIYYNYYVTGRGDSVKTVLRHLSSGTKIDVHYGYCHFYTVGNHLVKVTNTMISVFYNHDD